MTLMTSASVKQLPLHQKHVQLQAKLGQFGDWEVPLYYTSILEEHDAVRTRAGLFDISHMGNFYFEGAETASYLNSVLARNIEGMRFSQALYMPLLNEKGGFVDDIIVYRIDAQRFYIIVNAGNVEKDFQWFTARTPKSVTFKDLSPQMGLLALQGPLAPQILDRAFPGNNFSALAYYHFQLWRDGMVARTGYTGEDGFEIMVSQKDLPEIWDKIMSAGKENGIAPVGFGARDTLRLEAGMPLYGHDMNDDVTPMEAGLGWAVDTTKTAFPGAAILARQKAEGTQKKLVGIEMIDRGIPRQDHEIAKDGKIVGKVTSGSYSPTLKKNIAMGYVPIQLAIPETGIDIMIRDKALKAKVIKLPFYKRKK